MRKVTIIHLFFLSGITSAFAGVINSIQHTAVTVEPGQYDLRAEGDVIMNDGGGVNVSGHFRTGIIEDMLDIEGFAGTGKTDFKMGVLTQFNLLPDLPGQIALGFFGGAAYVYDDYGDDSQRRSLLALTTGVLTSKKFDTSFGSVAPYLGFQIEAILKSGTNYTPLTGIVGAEWIAKDAAPWKFYSEFDVDVSESVYLIGVGAAYTF